MMNFPMFCAKLGSAPNSCENAGFKAAKGHHAVSGLLGCSGRHECRPKTATGAANNGRFQRLFQEFDARYIDLLTKSVV